MKVVVFGFHLDQKDTYDIANEAHQPDGYV